MEIKIDYDGEYPCLCTGHLIVTIDDKVWDFGRSALVSGGDIYTDEEDGMCTEQGDWEIEEYPRDFPDEYKELVLNKVREEIPQGCCGGCI